VKSRRTYYGLSLVEILVVMAIVMLIAGMLLPAACRLVHVVNSFKSH
jgi:Tfp pilus assembly protein FimT